MGLPNTSGWINIDFYLSFMPIKLELRIKTFLGGPVLCYRKSWKKSDPLWENSREQFSFCMQQLNAKC